MPSASRNRLAAPNGNADRISSADMAVPVSHDASPAASCRAPLGVITCGYGVVALGDIPPGAMGGSRTHRKRLRLRGIEARVRGGDQHNDAQPMYVRKGNQPTKRLHPWIKRTVWDNAPIREGRVGLQHGHRHSEASPPGESPKRAHASLHRSDTGGPGGASARPMGTLNATPPAGPQEGPNKLNGTRLQYTTPPMSGASVTVPPCRSQGGLR